jgi:glucoamylase
VSDAARLVRGDLAFTLARWRQSCFDLWEEEEGQHYYTLRVQAAALQHGAEWMHRGRKRDSEEARSLLD